ncbi:MAG: GNAT family N-acetyltransferase [Oscillospiraceae bacterium]
MLNITLKDGYSIRLLTEADRSEVLALCARCGDYYQLHCGVLPAEREVDEIFLDLPDGKGYEDKFVLGVSSAQNKLVGVIDIIRDYPIQGEWMLGLMLLDPAKRGNGLGKAVHSALVEWAKRLGATSFRIGVIEENKNGQAFWAAMGYRKLKEVSMALLEKTHTVDVMTLTFSD